MGTGGQDWMIGHDIKLVLFQSTFGDTLCQELELGNFCAGETGSHMTAS